MRHWYIFAKILKKLRLNKIHCAVQKYYCFYKNFSAVSSIELRTFMKDLCIDNIECSVPEYYIKQYLAHKFNLLGSHWKCLNKQADSVCQLSSYQEINWQLDYKSGYEFNPHQRSCEILGNKLPDGVDIKAPWELSRMYHLPQLALASMYADAVVQQELALEFKNQLMDFFDHNPVGYGVNWTCAMEVAIRAVNILIAHDIFCNIDSIRKNREFQQIILHRIIEHGRFILFNLEKSKHGNNNHYLSNLCGLLFISSYIVTKETKTWQNFASQEMLIEIDKQFFDDGGSAEGSTAYHRLSSELVVYSVALMLRLHFHIPSNLQKKIRKIGRFMSFITTHSGNIIQIGDNDSGHLLRLTEMPNISSIKYGELESNELWAGRTADLIESMFVDKPAAYIEDVVLKLLSDNQKFNNIEIHDVDKMTMCNDTTKTLPYVQNSYIKFKRHVDLSGLSYNIMPDFGLVLFETDGFQLFVRIPPTGRFCSMAHMHDDIMHWEYYLDGEGYYMDPGSFVYSSDPHKRDFYRSNKAHNVPIHTKSLLTFYGLWSAKMNYTGKIKNLTQNTISILIRVGEMEHERIIEVKENGLMFTDISNAAFECNITSQILYSFGYGKR